MSTGGKEWPRLHVERVSGMFAAYETPEARSQDAERETYVPISSVAERLLSDEAIRAVHAFLFPGTEYAGRDEYPSLLGALEAALVAAAFTEEEK